MTSKHRFEITIEVDDDAIRQWNEDATRQRRGLQYDPDPSEWNLDEITRAFGDELATGEVTSYDAA